MAQKIELLKSPSPLEFLLTFLGVGIDIFWNLHNVCIMIIIIQQIVTLSKYGHDALDICHP